MTIDDTQASTDRPGPSRRELLRMSAIGGGSAMAVGLLGLTGPSVADGMAGPRTPIGLAAVPRGVPNPNNGLSI